MLLLLGERQKADPLSRKASSFIDHVLCGRGSEQWNTPCGFIRTGRTWTQVCLMEGAFPQRADEIGIGPDVCGQQRAAHRGRYRKSEDQTWTITGLVALS